MPISVQESKQLVQLQCIRTCPPVSHRFWEVIPIDITKGMVTTQDAAGLTEGSHAVSEMKFGPPVSQRENIAHTALLVNGSVHRQSQHPRFCATVERDIFND